MYISWVELTRQAQIPNGIVIHVTDANRYFESDANGQIWKEIKMNLKLTHSKRPFQEVLTTLDKFRDRYMVNLSVDEICKFNDDLHMHGKAELIDADGTLFIEVIK